MHNYKYLFLFSFLQARVFGKLQKIWGMCMLHTVETMTMWLPFWKRLVQVYNYIHGNLRHLWDYPNTCWNVQYWNLVVYGLHIPARCEPWIIAVYKKEMIFGEKFVLIILKHHPSQSSPSFSIIIILNNHHPQASPSSIIILLKHHPSQSSSSSIIIILKHHHHQSSSSSSIIILNHHHPSQ